ncbi:MAG: hypothetical protein ACXWN4_00570 [Candidatus Limnocylindrales bacterium]
MLNQPVNRPSSDQNELDRTDPRGRRTAVLVGLLLVAFIVVAVAKPWGGQAPSSGLPSAGAGTPTSQPESPSVPPQPVRATSTPAGPAPVAFVTAFPPPAGATWIAIEWNRLAAEDPQNLVASVLRWRGGFIAVGSGIVDPASGATLTTPVWTSTDGASWEPLPSGTGTTFWPGARVIGIAELPAGLVALTQVDVGTSCGGGSPCPLSVAPVVVSWTSSDGREWSPRAFPTPGLSSPTAGAPILATGPGGLVAVSTGPGAHVATSSDGITWHDLPGTTIPPEFFVTALRATPTGYVAGGAWITSQSQAATLWSADGRKWSAAQILPRSTDAGTGPSGPRNSSVVDSLVAGRDGFIALGGAGAGSAPAAPLWWQSSDARVWQSLSGYPPLGSTPCTAQNCDRRPNGTIVGDGERLIALRGGPDAAAWTSADGLVWSSIHVGGELPSEAATQAVLVPGGVLLSDGSTTWFGQAVVK